MPLGNPISVAIQSGTYSGNDANDRQISTGFKCSLAIVYRSDTIEQTMLTLVTKTIDIVTGGGFSWSTDCLLHASDGFVVDKFEMNKTGETYAYWAIQE